MYFGKRLKGRSAVNIAKPGTPYEVKVVLTSMFCWLGFSSSTEKKKKLSCFGVSTF